MQPLAFIYSRSNSWDCEERNQTAFRDLAQSQFCASQAEVPFRVARAEHSRNRGSGVLECPWKNAKSLSSKPRHLRAAGVSESGALKL